MTEGYAHPEMLCDTEWLGDHLDDPNVRVVDCDQFMEYRRGHIRNARPSWRRITTSRKPATKRRPRRIRWSCRRRRSPT